MKITTINSIETSALCNLNCQYCPARLQSKYRPVGLMTMETFKRVIEVVYELCRRGTQLEINLFSVGEPLLNPAIVEMVRYARQKLPFRQSLHLNTNGLLVTREIAIALKDAGISHIDITCHDHYHTAKAVRIFREVGIDGNLSIDPVVVPNNWAGQVDWFEPEYNAGPCPWLRRGQVMVMWDGRITRCCIDAFATGILGSIFDDDIDDLDSTPFALCEKCHHSIPGTADDVGPSLVVPIRKQAGGGVCLTTR